MKNKQFSVLAICLIFLFTGCQQGQEKTKEPTRTDGNGTLGSSTEDTSLDLYKELYRPQFHFSTPANWMNDPNGMFYKDGEYHLFYQHFPDSTVWGPMHWGHATSNDLVFWENQGIALAPDSLGYIFSGSIVVDESNSSGLGTKETPAVVAIYTYHDPKKESEGKSNFQTQGLAYSLDNGYTWNKYSSNPILINPGTRDFRDPKVFWHGPTDKWIMTLAVGDHVEFFASDNLTEWLKLSEFGSGLGFQDGVWECPDLIEIPIENSNQTQWVLIVSVGDNESRGSATQYFTGDFDGFSFTTEKNRIGVKWLDHGWDNYAGVTWNNIPENDGRKIFIGWMNNWRYAHELPTSTWRGSMTVPRNLTLFSSGGRNYIRSYPVLELDLLRTSAEEINKTLVNGELDLSSKISATSNNMLDLELLVSQVRSAGSWQLIFSNYSGDTLKAGFDHMENRYFVDRSDAGKTGLDEDFGKVHYGKRLANGQQLPVRILLDKSSIEFFGDKGQVVFTDRFFVRTPFDKLTFISEREALLVEGMVYNLRSIWKDQ